MKRKTTCLLFFIAIFVLSGCGRHYAMTDRKEMYITPSPQMMEDSEVITAIFYKANPIKTLAEGGDGRIAWPDIVWDSSGQEKKEHLLALHLGDYIGENIFLTVYVGPKKDLFNHRLGIADRGGTRIYNHLGEYKWVKDISSQVKFNEVKDFLPEIGPNSEFVQEYEKGSTEFESLKKLFFNFRLRELDKAFKYAYKKYGINLTEEQFNAIAEEDSIIYGLKQWLGYKGWMLAASASVSTSGSFTTLGIPGLLANIALFKVFQLPSIYGEKINKPGYMEYIGDSEHSAKMILRATDPLNLRIMQLEKELQDMKR